MTTLDTADLLFKEYKSVVHTDPARAADIARVLADHSGEHGAPLTASEFEDAADVLDLHTTEAARARALMVHCDEQFPPAEGCSPGEGHTFEYGQAEWWVLTEDEADDAWDSELDTYLDDVILLDLPGTLAAYFDREAWKRDARFDGRAHALGRYDGNEYDIKDPLTGATFVAYRIN